MRYLKKLDAFSAYYQSYINQGENEFQSTIGAVSTMILSILSLSYLIFQLYLWRTNQILPTIAQSNQIQVNNYDFVNQEIIVNFDPFDESDFNVFDLNNTIFYPVSQLCNITTYCDKQSQSSQIEQTSKNNTYVVKNFKLSSAKNKNIINENYLEFITCNDSIPNNFSNKCASQNVIDNYLKQKNWVEIIITYQSFNRTTRKLDSYQKSYLLKIQKNNPIYQQINLMVGVTSMKDGFLFPTLTKFNYLQSAEVLSQTIDENNIPLTIDLFIVDLLFQQDVQYPMLNTILANTGSITSLIFMLSILVQKFNQILLENYLVNEIISFYYPEFRNLRIKRKLYFRKKNSVKSKDGKNEYQPDEIIKIHQKAQQIAIEKLSILNIIYELSRIQFILQSLQEKENILQSRYVGIQLPLEIITKRNSDLTSLQINRNNSNSKIHVLQQLSDSSKYEQDQKKSNNNKLEVSEKKLKSIDLSFRKLEITQKDQNDKFINNQDDNSKLPKNQNNLIKEKQFIEVSQIDQDEKSNDQVEDRQYLKLHHSDMILLTYLNRDQELSKNKLKNSQENKFYQINNINELLQLDQ